MKKFEVGHVYFDQYACDHENHFHHQDHQAHPEDGRL